jgi:hypothetical protein
MKLQSARVTLASLVFLGASHVLAQSTEPPPILKIVQEAMKPGKGAAHEKSEAAYVRVFSKSKYPNYVAWEAMSGSTQVWFLEGYANYAGIEAASKISNAEPLKTTLDELDVQDSELRSGERTILARYRKDLSYLPASLNLGKAHFIWLNIVQVRHGHGDEYAEMRKIMNAAFEKTGAKWSRLVYIVGNAAVTDYLIAWPMESLIAMDQTTPWNNRETLGEGYERYRKLNADIVVSNEEILFAVNPRMSNPPNAYVEADPVFWAPKPAAK